MEAGMTAVNVEGMEEMIEIRVSIPSAARFGSTVSITQQPIRSRRTVQRAEIFQVHHLA